MLSLQAITFLVRDYDEAIDWFTGKLGFVLVEDTQLSPGKRWVTVSAESTGTKLLLAKPADDEQQAAIGNAAGGRVAFFLHTTNFAETHERLVKSGVKFRELPRHEPYGTVAVFEDLYGNPWDLIESRV
jgi:catechol 2,3-dioxygenase-like lactoylglutathione lyase family enzyme